MTDEMNFRICYENPREPVPQPELYEGYDLESAFYDYLPSGARATIAMDGYALEMTGLKFVDLVRSCLPLVEDLTKLPADASEELRASIPDLPEDAKAYYWLFGDFILWLPVIVFAIKGSEVRIYTRTRAETEGNPWIVWSERDRAETVLVSHAALVEELLTFLSTYLDDLVGAFPFLARDEKYQEYRSRIAEGRTRAACASKSGS